MIVYVISKDGKPLMPTTPARARKMLHARKAKCIRRNPFTIKLLFETTTYTQPMTLGIDTGSSKIGSAVVDEDGDVIYLSEVEIRNDIADKMKQRSKYRRNRRNLKTRYRAARWLNRKNSIKKDRFSPTMISKINSHLKEIKFVKSILPITHIIMETATFNPHALKNPNVLKNKWLYQRGANYGYSNSKAFVLDRDNHICQHCKGKSKNNRIEVHHIVPRSENGSDEHDNLISLCKTCHDNIHKGKIILKGGISKKQLKHATQMNSIRIQLLRLVSDAEETFGYITKEHRQLMYLPKEHYYDAVAIANFDNIRKTGSLNIRLETNLIYKKCISDGDYQQTKGIRSEQRIPTGKIFGFRKFDKVEYQGKRYFIKGRMSSGYAILMNINGEKINLKPIPKFEKMKRISARKSWITQEVALPKSS